VSPLWVIMLPKIQHEDEVSDDGNETRKRGIKGGPERCWKHRPGPNHKRTFHGGPRHGWWDVNEVVQRLQKGLASRGVLQGSLNTYRLERKVPSMPISAQAAMAGKSKQCGEAAEMEDRILSARIGSDGHRSTAATDRKWIRSRDAVSAVKADRIDRWNDQANRNAMWMRLRRHEERKGLRALQTTDPPQAERRMAEKKSWQVERVFPRESGPQISRRR
jgi:hypothetical protein